MPNRIPHLPPLPLQHQLHSRPLTRSRVPAAPDSIAAVCRVAPPAIASLFECSQAGETSSSGAMIVQRPTLSDPCELLSPLIGRAECNFEPPTPSSHLFGVWRPITPDVMGMAVAALEGWTRSACSCLESALTASFDSILFLSPLQQILSPRHSISFPSPFALLQHVADTSERRSASSAEKLQMCCLHRMHMLRPQMLEQSDGATTYAQHATKTQLALLA